MGTWPTNWGDGVFAGDGGGASSGGSGGIVLPIQPDSGPPTEGSVGSTGTPVITSFTASSGSISSGGSTTLSFTVTGATSVTINDGSGAVLIPSGTTSITVSGLTSTTTYTITASNDSGFAFATITILVHGANAENVRSHQIRRQDRQGDSLKIQMGAGTPALNYPALYDAGKNVVARQPRGNTAVVQMADQTEAFTENDILAFDHSGNAKDSQVPVGDLITTSGAGGTTQGLTALGPGSWYGQVPRGAQNGSNNNFLLDYTLANPYAVLHLNGVGQLPSIQGDPSNFFATMATPGGEFSISGRNLTTGNTPRSGEKFYIYYFRKDPIADVVSATVNFWSSFTSADGIQHGLPYAQYTLGTDTANLLSSNVLYSLTHDSLALSSFPPTISGFSGSYVRVYVDGTLPANDDTFINIYDCYITLILADASVYEIRPVSWAFTSGSDSTGQMSSWAASTGYGSGTLLIDSNGNVQMSTSAGTSGAGQPVWATSGTTTDGGVTWVYQGDGTTQSSTTGQIANPNLAFDSDTVPPTTFAAFKRTHYSGLSDSGVFTLFF